VRNFLAGHSETLLALTDWNLPVSTGEKLIEEPEKDPRNAEEVGLS
jgi:hypothetical protein